MPKAASPQGSDQFVDLFGNSTLTPQQIIQKQIGRAVQGANESFASASVPTRTAAMLGAGLGGLFRQVLMDKGVIPKDPEVERAEKLAVLREQVNKIADEKGVKITDNLEDYADLVAGKALQMNMEDVAAKAVQMKLVAQASKRAIVLENSKVFKNVAEGQKAGAEARKADAAAEAAPQLNAAKLDQLQSSAALNKVKAAGLQVLTTLKATDPNRARVQTFNKILADFDARLAKDPNATFTAGERKKLDELKGFDPINKLLSQTLGGVGPSSGSSDEAVDHIDFSGTP